VLLSVKRSEVLGISSASSSSSSASPQTMCSRLPAPELARLNRHIALESLVLSVEHYRKLATYRFRPQRCRLYANPTTTYQTQSGLLDHATVHHGHWYSSVMTLSCRSLNGIWNGSMPRFVTARCTGTIVTTRPTLSVQTGPAPSILGEIARRRSIAVSLA